MFLSIVRSDSFSIPKNVELESGTRLTVNHLSCWLEGVRLSVSERVEETEKIEVRFSRE